MEAIKYYFNTSYVSVQDYSKRYFSNFIFISIHRMCRFKSLHVRQTYFLLAFQYIVCVGSRVPVAPESVAYTLFQYIVCVGSSVGTFCPKSFVELFQYIVCVGSRRINIADYGLQFDFNTSYVSVQATSFDFKPYCIIISIHRMCRFKKFKVSKLWRVHLFQYIVCVGSRLFKRC